MRPSLPVATVPVLRVVATAAFALFVVAGVRLWMVAADLRASRGELRRVGAHDELTGLANRAVFARVVHSLAAGRATVLLIDVDIFRSVNENFGQATGDAVLRSVGQLIRGVVGPDAVVARLGGDEFAVVIDAPLAAAEAYAADIVVAARRPIEVGPHTVEISLSVGVAPVVDDDNPLRRASQALLEAKRFGRDTHVVLDHPAETPAPTPADAS